MGGLFALDSRNGAIIRIRDFAGRVKNGQPKVDQPSLAAEDRNLVSYVEEIAVLAGLGRPYGYGLTDTLRKRSNQLM